MSSEQGPSAVGAAKLVAASATRSKREKSLSVIGGVLVALALLGSAFPGRAAAQTAYVADAEAETATAFDSDTLLAAPAIPVGAISANVAISPDGRIAYVSGEFEYPDGHYAGKVSMIDTATDAVIGAIPGFSFPGAIAISPDGGTLYVVNGGTQSILTASTATDTVTGSPIAIGDYISGLALSPDGTTLYFSLVAQGTVVPIDTATWTVGAPIAVGEEPDSLAFSPDGSRLYVPNYGSESISMIDTGSETVIDEIGVGLYPQTIVPDADGNRVYVVDNGSNQISVIDTATDEVLGEPTDVIARPIGAAITADGRRLLVVGSEAKQAEAIDTATMTPLAGRIALGGYAEGMAIVPAQTPVPEFSVAAATAGAERTFDAAGSHVYDGRITRNDWDFGDGTSVVDAGPTPTHTYAMPGDYVVTLTVSNGQGCQGFAFTGNTAICGGPSIASTAKSVSIGGGATPAGTVDSEGQPVGNRVEPSPSGPPAATVPPRGVRIHCRASAGPRGCKVTLQIVSGRPTKLAHGKWRRLRPEGPVMKVKLARAKSRLVRLRVRPKFAARLAGRSRVLVRRTSVIRGEKRTDFPRLPLVG